MSLELEPFDLADCVQRALSMYEAIVKLKRLKLTLDYGCIATHVKGDATRLKQIIANVLNNVRSRAAARSLGAGGKHGCALISSSIARLCPLRRL